MFICGPTVYDDLHAGHARMLLFYDLVSRYLRYRGKKVTALVNITDIDPKISARAQSEGVSPQYLAQKYAGRFLDDMSALAMDGFVFARVSDHVDVAKQLVKNLLKEGKAYSADGNIYLDTTTISKFGELSKSSREELDDCRLDISQGKRSPADILVWNASDHIGVSFADRHLGTGIPWWHTQDSSVAMANFGGRYDIHGGATELVYPHHEFHLSQLKVLTSSARPVRVWSHVGLVYSGGHKMSKSAGNVVTVRQLLKYGTNAIRLYFYSKPYRQQFDFSEQDLAKFEEIDQAISAKIGKTNHAKSNLKAFLQCLEDDFDSPSALKVMMDSVRSGNGKDLQVMAGILGLRY
jgi:cysteinyl-tRNA synthetase